ncbi:MAG: hypothetical protein JXR68_12905 [Bacteroidales bacterium]|nr:hypothetical protein [Bacteroidales bacterium]
MERKKHLIVFVAILFFILPNLKASYKTEIYNYFINSEMNKWENTLINLNNLSQKSDALTLELLNYNYGYIAWCIGNDKEQKAKTYLEISENYLSLLEDKKYNLSMINVYKSAFNGFKISFNKVNAPFLGPESIKFAEKALELDENNPFAHMQLGNIQFYMPSMFGGSKQLAISYYKKAQILMEQNLTVYINDWNYINLLVTIAQAYTDNENYILAKKYYEIILSIEPDFLWVKNELYPQILKLSSNE